MRRWRQICRPERASIAHASPPHPVTYNTPSITSGVDWKFPVEPVWNVHADFS
jgi:hypothetical protein